MSHLISFVLFYITRRQKSGPLWDPLNQSKAWRQRCRSRYRAKNVTPHVPTRRTTCTHLQPNCHRHHTSDPASCTFAVLCNWLVKPCDTCSQQQIELQHSFHLPKVTIFQDVTSCQLVNGYQCFGKYSCLHFQDNSIFCNFLLNYFTINSVFLSAVSLFLVWW